MVHILVLGATGYTGQLITRYLAVHRERASFTLGLGGRSKSKLDKLVTELGLSDVKTFTVNVTDDSSVEALFSEAEPKVVLTTVGPYWIYGMPVARACAKHGVHYVDITAEVPYVRRMIDELDFLATKTHAVLVPSCGFDSLPSDVLCFLSARTMRSALETASGSQSVGGAGVAESHTMFSMKGGLSGGTLETMRMLLETFSRKELQAMSAPDFLSPLKLRRPEPLSLVYKLPATHPERYGHVYPLGPGNVCTVQRTRGLLQLNSNKFIADTTQGEDIQPAYAEDFSYSESLAASNRFTAFIVGLGIAFGGACLLFFSPARWIFKRVVVQPGEGPSDEVLEKGSLKGLNVSVSTPLPGSANPIVVESTVRGRGDPGYALTAVMISETALGLLARREKLARLGQAGGVLTPTTALGAGLLKRLSASGRFEFESSVRGEIN